jgi:hypothetical protein
MRNAVAAVAVVAVATACTGGTGSPGRSSTTRPLSPSGSARAADTRRVLVGPLSIELPDGWRLSSDADFGHVCVEPSGAREQEFGCAGLDMYYDWAGGFLPGNEASDFRTSPGWYHGTGVAPCPVDPTKGPHGENDIRSSSVPKRSLAPVGDRRADYYEWAASCDSGYQWHPHAWYLPVSKVLVFNYLGTATGDTLMRDARFDKGRWILAYLHGMSGAAGARTVDVDTFTWLSGAAANRYAKAHDMESPVPNDYLIVDDDESTVSIRISERATVTSSFRLRGTEPGHPKQVGLEQLAGFLATPVNWGTPFHLHLDADGVIDQVVEQYVP